MTRAAVALAVLSLSGCIYLPRTIEVYDGTCHVGARQMTLQAVQIGAFGSCQGQGCGELLVAAGAVAATSAVVSGTIVVAGNIVYWFEKEGRCALAPATTGELMPADLTLAGMQLGKSTLQDVISSYGIAPLRNGEVDELCYRSESPLQAAWVLFGAGEAGNYEKLTQFRVVTVAPPGITCLPSARLTTQPATDSGIRIGMPAAELEAKLGPRLRVTVDDGRVTSYEIRLAEQR